MIRRPAGGEKYFFLAKFVTETLVEGAAGVVGVEEVEVVVTVFSTASSFGVVFTCSSTASTLGNTAAVLFSLETLTSTSAFLEEVEEESWSSSFFGSSVVVGLAVVIFCLK